MKVSLNWLKEFVEIPVEPQRLKSDLTMVGLNVESVAAVGDDWVLEVEITTNRPDCLSHAGVARELAALYRKPLALPQIRLKESATPASSAASIQIIAPDLCARYCGRVIRNVAVKPSPAWLQRRLETLGLRPINNVADATNYVLLELGHPLHAFDLASLRRRKIVVRRARKGELLRTLDGVLRTLRAEDLVIADGERAVALAGVMGGEDSQITAATRDVLLESAWFEPVSIRHTAKFHGMRTEASYRFERGADIEMAPLALNHTAAMIAELAGGEVLEGIIDIYPRLFQSPEIILRRREVLRILGADVPGEEIERILKSLSFRITALRDQSWQVLPPSFRLDIKSEIDLIEEVARHYGYGHLPARVRAVPPRIERDETREKLHRVASILVGLGYREIITPSMIDPADNARFTEQPPVPLANPLSQDASVLRSSPVPGMIQAIRWNLDHGCNNVRFFEVGKTYTARREGLPDERRVLTLGLTGHRREASVHDGERPLDLFDLKGDLETLLEALEVPRLRFRPDGRPYYEVGWAGQFLADSEPLALFGQLSADVVRHYKLRQPVWVAEVDLERLLSFSLRKFAFKPFSRFPAVERDFSLVVPESVTYGHIEEAIRRLALEEIQRLYPVDLFRGSTIPSGHYSLLLRVSFQSQTHTLTSQQIAQLSERVLTTLGALGIRLRS